MVVLPVFFWNGTWLQVSLPGVPLEDLCRSWRVGSSKSPSAEQLYGLLRVYPKVKHNQADLVSTVYSQASPAEPHEPQLPDPQDLTLHLLFHAGHGEGREGDTGHSVQSPRPIFIFLFTFSFNSFVV